uniref:Uncharacterized protein n=1 Tax=Anguilla anguilla TaxID=7936 RepID=A0A0E9Q5S9_ANGAN
MSEFFNFKPPGFRHVQHCSMRLLPEWISSPLFTLLPYHGLLLILISGI